MRDEEKFAFNQFNLGNEFELSITSVHWGFFLRIGKIWNFPTTGNAEK